MGPCIIMLKHEVMAADEWHNSGPQVLVTVTLWIIMRIHEVVGADDWQDNGSQDLKVSLCIQIAIDKMQLCLSIAYACLPVP